MSRSRKFWRHGDPFVWLSAGATGFALLLILGVLWLIAAGGLGYFWPKEIVQFDLKDGTVLLGQVLGEEDIPPSMTEIAGEKRIRIRTANRKLNRGQEFVWLDESRISGRSTSGASVFLERDEYGPFIGYVESYTRDGNIVASGEDATNLLRDRIGPLAQLRKQIRSLEKTDVGRINSELTRLNREKRSLERGTERFTQIEAEESQLRRDYETLVTEIRTLRQGLFSETVGLRTATGETLSLAVGDVYRVVEPNKLNFAGNAKVYLSRFWTFVSEEPREANLEGGVLPAIFGTVLMTFLMTLAVVPLGVLAGLYLREYARQGRLVRAVRIAVNNLAGVPSIVFGIFGLGFFVYFVGAAVDQSFFGQTLPTPTYGTGGILWSALTLALLTIPVVIVATEEGLAAVPRAVREGSLALGANKWETTWRIVLPAASPSILTGVILAISRAAGEVAPLMLTGAVKTATQLPVDSVAPFLHLERKFMHLGFHIYDLGFQSPNVEAAKPMVYMTTFLLVVIVILLNLTAMWVRNRLWSRYRSASF